MSFNTAMQQEMQQEQGSMMIARSIRPPNRTWRTCNKNSIWLMSKSFLTDVTCALLLRAFMLNT